MTFDAPARFDSLRIEVPATADRLSEIRRQLLAWLRPIGLPADSAADIVLVVNEAATNCVEHAYRDVAPGLIRVDACHENGRIEIDISDSGAWQTPPSQPTTRGRGLPIMRAVSERVELDASARGTTVRMSFPAGTAGGLQDCGSRTT